MKAHLTILQIISVMHKILQRLKLFLVGILISQKGILFPAPIAPYSVHLVGLNLHEPEVIDSSNNLYGSLWQEGVDCLFDDRIDESAGVKFNDADLMGFPIRVIVSGRGVKNGTCEVKFRKSSETNTVLLTEATAFIKQSLLSID